MIPTETLRAARRLLGIAKVIRRARREASNLDSALNRARWQQRHAAAILRTLEVDVKVSGAWPRTGMIVANHLGYLDVIVIAAQLPCVFVSKSEVRDWPVIGALLQAAGAILTDRTDRRSVAGTNAAILRTLEQGLPVVLFPEGTSSDGSRVLPFRSSLLESAADPRWQVHPLAISYQGSGGEPGRDLSYWGNATFLPHLIRLAGIRPISATLSLGEHPIVGTPRKLASTLLEEEVRGLHGRIGPGDSVPGDP